MRTFIRIFKEVPNFSSKFYLVNRISQVITE